MDFAKFSCFKTEKEGKMRKLVNPIMFILLGFWLCIFIVACMEVIIGDVLFPQPIQIIFVSMLSWGIFMGVLFHRNQFESGWELFWGPWQYFFVVLVRTILTPIYMAIALYNYVRYEKFFPPPFK